MYISCKYVLHLFGNPVKNLGTPKYPNNPLLVYVVCAQNISTKNYSHQYWPDALLLLLDAIHGGLVNLCYLVGRSAPVSIWIIS